MGQAEPEMGGAAAPPHQAPGVRPTHVERINSGIILLMALVQQCMWPLRNQPIGEQTVTTCADSSEPAETEHRAT